MLNFLFNKYIPKIISLSFIKVNKGYNLFSSYSYCLKEKISVKLCDTNDIFGL